MVYENGDLFPNDRNKVLHFSGGHSSGLMVLQCYRPGDIVLFCNTTREHPDTYRFVRDFQSINNIPVITVTGDWQRDVIEKEKVIPNMFKRKCTLNLKIKAARRYLRSVGVKNYMQCIGFREDEDNRVLGYTQYWKGVTTIFPLYEIGLNKADVEEFWAPIPYRLKIPSILKNCDLCFLKGLESITRILAHYPGLADKWIDDEENKNLNPKGYTYHNGVTMRQIRDRAILLSPKPSLIDGRPLYNCYCGS